MFVCSVTFVLCRGVLCDRLHAGVAGSNPACGMVMYRQVKEVSVSGWSFFQRVPTDCGASECESEGP
jgi:hypothetical protein